MGWWSVAPAPDGDAIGQVGVFRRETGPETEIGWYIHRAHWNQGYATEAARAALEYSIRRPNTAEIVARVAPTNDASIAVARKIGMLRAGESDLYGEPHWLYSFASRAG
jgi:RimJ/RimL family protein N-acetyltransferase